jgi:hypothetical protein
MNCSLTVVLAFCLLIAAAASSADTLRRSVGQLVQRKNALARIESRNAWLEAALLSEREGASRATLHSPLSVALLAPYYSCPYTLLRSNLVSEHFDGGKWTCGIPETKSGGACVVYSFGSSENDVFEKHILSVNPSCEIHVFDPTSKPLRAYHFHKYGLCAHGSTFVAGRKTYPCRSLEHIFQELNHTEVTVLKMDVEGAEWDVFQDVQWENLRIGQILVEFHDQDAGYTLNSIIRHYLNKLEKAGFFLFSMEPVCAGCPGQFELGFLQVNWSPFPIRTKSKVRTHSTKPWRALTSIKGGENVSEGSYIMNML